MSSPSDSAATPAFHILTRHFLTGLCRPRVLDDAGQEGLHRVFLGTLAGAITGGLLLTRVFGVKYAAFAGLRGTEAHELARLADTAFLLCIPMLVVAALANVHAGALFPDDIDYRVCMVLPVRRAVVFRAKLAALAIFVGVAVAAVHVALVPLLLLMWGGEGLDRALLARMPVFLLAGFGASLTALTTVIVAHGVTLAVLPVQRRAAGMASVRSAILVTLVVLVPLVTRLSSIGSALADRATWLQVVPPLWFVGLEQGLLGRADPFFASLAWRGVAAVLIGTVLSAGLYTRLYRRFDSPAAVVAPVPCGRGWRQRLCRRERSADRAACGGVYAFTLATLWRSPLHQGVFTTLAACGLGLVVQRGTGSPGAVLAVPFVLILLSCAALKSALSLPHERRANWIFRQAEREANRPQQLRSVTTLFWRFGIVLPIVVSVPVQLWAGGPRMLAAVPVALTCGWLLMECLLRGWRRIPFTCTYLPGRRVMAHTALIVLNSYVVFTVAGVGLSYVAPDHPGFVAATLAVLLAAAAAMRAGRLALWRTAPLEFDATPDDQPQTLGLCL